MLDIGRRRTYRICNKWHGERFTLVYICTKYSIICHLPPCKLLDRYSIAAVQCWVLIQLASREGAWGKQVKYQTPNSYTEVSKWLWLLYLNQCNYSWNEVAGQGQVWPVLGLELSSILCEVSQCLHLQVDIKLGWSLCLRPDFTSTYPGSIVSS